MRPRSASWQVNMDMMISCIWVARGVACRAYRIVSMRGGRGGYKFRFGCALYVRTGGIRPQGWLRGWTEDTQGRCVVRKEETLLREREGARGESGADNSVWVPTGTDRHTLRTPSSTRMGARRARSSLGLRRAHVSDTAPANPRHWRCSIAWHGMNDDVRGVDIQHTRKHRVQAKEETEGELKICDGR